MQLVCPAGNLPALKAAVRQGADAVYVGFRDDTNARHFAGLNMDDKQFDGAVAHIRQHQRKLYVAVNTYPQPKGWERWQRAVDRAADHGVDALIAGDPGVLQYASSRHPQMALHLFRTGLGYPCGGVAVLRRALRYPSCGIAPGVVPGPGQACGRQQLGAD